MGPWVLALTAAALLWSGGYVFGARLGKRARAALQAERRSADELRLAAMAVAEDQTERRDQAERRVEQADRRVVELQARAESHESQRSVLQRSLLEQEAEVHRLTEHLETTRKALLASGEEQRALRGQLEGRNTESQKIRSQLGQLADKLDAQADDDRLRRVVAEVIRPLQEGTRADRLQAVVTEALRPMVDGERLGVDFGRLSLGTTRKDLNALLTEIARQAALTTVIISDERGLLLAANEGTREAEVRAGLSALALTLADRFEQCDVPEPLAVLVHDNANQVMLSRLFNVDRQRYVLTAVTKGRFVPPNLLDPALDRVEQLMADWTVTQERPAVTGR